MPDKFDPYREALVVETLTVWPKELDRPDEGDRGRLESLLHANAAEAGHLEYVRLPTGFCRKITVTAEDLARLGGG
jgi:hypothetical protein